MIKQNRQFDEDDLKQFYNKERKFMRLDKYLKVSRLVKRRTLAKELATKVE